MSGILKILSVRGINVRCGKEPVDIGLVLFCRIGKFSEFPIWQKSNYRTASEKSMSLPQPAAGGESCKQDSFLLYRIQVSKGLPGNTSWIWHKKFAHKRKMAVCLQVKNIYK